MSPPHSAGPPATERVYLLASRPQGSSPDAFALQMEELSELVLAAGAHVVGTESLGSRSPDAALYFGRGTVERISMQRHQIDFDTLVSNDELTPRQQRNLEAALDCRVIDRTDVILEIFARHARTHDGRLQVELAQLQHLLPRLVGDHSLSRLGGGIGTRGPGEQQLEYDRRRIRAKISSITRELELVRRHRARRRLSRAQATLKSVAIVGYTNSGKSTLLNRLTGAGVLADDQPFVTLDPTTRQLTLPSGRAVVLTDTVGFIQKLPTELVAAFRATLEEVTFADALVHLVDCSDPSARAQIECVESVLAEMGAADKPTVVALNKTDLIGPATLRRLAGDVAASHTHVVTLSALTGSGLERLLGAIQLLTRAEMTHVSVLMPHSRPGLLALVRRLGDIDSETYLPEGVEISAHVPAVVLAQLARYLRQRREAEVVS